MKIGGLCSLSILCLRWASKLFIGWSILKYTKATIFSFCNSKLFWTVKSEFLSELEWIQPQLPRLYPEIGCDDSHFLGALSFFFSQQECVFFTSFLEWQQLGGFMLKTNPLKTKTNWILKIKAAIFFSISLKDLFIFLCFSSV